MGNPARYVAMFVGILAHYGILVTTGIPYWRWSSWQISDPLYGRIPTFDGIWWTCMSLKTGGFTCSNYGAPTLYVDAGIQMCRALMTLACLASFAAMAISLMVLDCTILFGKETSTKTKMARICAALFLFSGLCTLVATSWFAWRVTYEYYDPYYQEREFKYNYGPCLFLGWVSMGFAFLCAALLGFNCCSYSEDNYKNFQSRRPTYRPSYPSIAAMYATPVPPPETKKVEAKPTPAYV